MWLHQLLAGAGLLAAGLLARQAFRLPLLEGRWLHQLRQELQSDAAVALLLEGRRPYQLLAGAGLLAAGAGLLAAGAGLLAAGLLARHAGGCRRWKGFGCISCGRSFNQMPLLRRCWKGGGHIHCGRS